MFTNQLPRLTVPFAVSWSKYAQRHYLKSFEKKYKGKQWEITRVSIEEDLKRLAFSDLQKTQQVDELYHCGCYWIFKYDFRVAKTKESAKSSGNRCLVFADCEQKFLEILLIYAKTDLHKNGMGEQQYIESVLKSEFREYLTQCVK